MIRLEELVTAVLNEFAIARTKAVLFSTQMAVDFRQHEVLRHLPIPSYIISGAEVCVPFATVKIAGGDREPVSIAIEASQLATAAKDLTASLAEEEVLKEGVALDPDQVALWREAAPAIGERFASDAAEAPSIELMSVIYGYVVRERYLLSLAERSGKMGRARIREILKRRYPDMLGDVARQLMRRELEKRLASRAVEEQLGGAEEKGKGEKKPLALYVEVEAAQLKDREHVAILRLHLEEGMVEGMSVSEIEGVGDEERRTGVEDT